MITLAGLELPPDLIWSNEFSAVMAARSSRRTIGGSLVVQDTGLSGGRPIDLTGDDGWALRPVVETLFAWAGTPGWTGTLTLHDGRTFAVRFRIGGDEAPVTATMVREESQPDAATYYVLNLRLETV